MSLLDYARRVAKWIASLSIWYKLLVGTILGAIGGSTVVGILNTYAIYSYSYSYGARIPVEGVPYLGLAVSVVSFTFLVSSLTCAIVVYGLLALLTDLLRRLFSWAIDHYRKSRRLADVPISQKANALLSVITSLLSAIAGVAAIMSSTGGLEPETSWLRVNLPMQTIIIGAIAFIVIVTVLSVWPWLVKWFAVALTAALIATTIVAMFSPSVYGRFLRTIKYGGGTAVKVRYDDPDNKLEEYEGYLFLVTSKAYILYDDNLREYVEIPTDNVTRIRYSVNASHTLPQVARQSTVTPNDAEQDDAPGGSSGLSPPVQSDPHP